MVLNLIEAPSTNMEFEKIRSEVRNSILNPEDELRMFNSMYLASSDDPFIPEIFFEIEGLNSERVKNFIKIIIEEIERAKTEGLQLSQKLNFEQLKNEGRENIFEHEMGHIRQAGECGVDLDKCRLMGFFTEYNGKLNLGMIFNPPVISNGEIKIKIALAVQNPSGSDLTTVTMAKNSMRSRN